MLTELYVKHFVLINELRLHYGRGLHVFTGETGAGKSLLLDATRVVLGGRSSVNVIQRGADHAIVEAVFDVVPESVTSMQLAAWDIPIEENTLLLSRTLYPNGRSVCRINGRTATVQMLKALGDTLVEMQGQHESQALLTSRYQRHLVDLYGRHTTLCDETSHAFIAWEVAKQNLSQAQISERERAQQMDMLKFQVAEIESAAIEVGEEDALREQRQQLMGFERLKGHLERLTQALDHPSIGAVAQLSVAEAEVTALVERAVEVTEVQAMLSSARVQAEEAAFVISKFASKMEADPERLAAIDERLVVLRGLMRKYGATTAEVLVHLEEAHASLKQLEKHEEIIERCRGDVDQAKAHYDKCARSLHIARVQSASALQAQVEQTLGQLFMTDARFEVSVEAAEDKPTADGIDEISFLFSGNRGEPLLSLQKVASGGELSRTLLAMKVVVADLENIDTLIFDEIDTGISGEAAQRVAQMLRVLGTDRQVLCVTHAAQVAAAGHVHFQIFKETEQERVQTKILELSDLHRTDEIGRLLGAAMSDDTALQHAKALLESFRKEPTSIK